jgi:hypothetical protein
MMVEQLGRLERIENLRSVWHNEATDFTPWLEQHIDLLSEALGLDIQLVEREVPVGDFSVDLVGEEPGSGRPVIIENQLERTNHDHLGKLLTYSAGKGGGVIIWVAKEIRPEHRNALDWLNNATQGNIDFYGVELELLKIGGSPKAPNFKVVVAPKSDGAATGTARATAPSDRDVRYQSFFKDLLERIKARPPRVTNASKVGYQSWLATPSGKSGFSFGLAFVRGQKFQIELYIDLGNRAANKGAFHDISMGHDVIEEELGAKLDWQRLDNRRASRVAWFWADSATIMDNSEKLDKLKVWAIDSYFKFRDVLSPYLENLPSSLEAEQLVTAEEPALGEVPTDADV